ncbi:MAG: hypothetical protein ACXQTD_07430 [Candidatus Syntropharchaeia archaeon]
MPKEARVEIVLQRIEEDIGEELNVIPQKIRRYGVNNIFQRVFAYLLGWKSDGKPIKLSATSAGALKVATVGAGYENIDTLSGTAGVSWSGALSLAWIASQVRLLSLDYPYVAKLSADGATYTDEIYIDADNPQILDISAQYVKVKRYGGSDASYWIMGVM